MAPNMRCVLLIGFLFECVVAAPSATSASNFPLQVPSSTSIPTTVSAENVSQTALDKLTDSISIKNETTANSVDAITTTLPLPSFTTVDDSPKLKSLNSKRQEVKVIETNSTKAPPLPGEYTPGYVRSDGTYVIEDSANTPCILAFFRTQITVSYPTDEKNNKHKLAVTRPSGDSVVSGWCDRDSQRAVLDLQWEDGIFSLYFKYDTLIDSWYVSRFTFKYNTSAPLYKGAEKAETVLVKSDENRRFWTTTHARSFRCYLLHDVLLKDEDDRFSATVHFDEARVQALTISQNFKTPKHCIHRVHRDEMVPIAVGGTLAGLTLVTILGYAIFRYIKVKKFSYGTME